MHSVHINYSCAYFQFLFKYLDIPNDYIVCELVWFVSYSGLVTGLAAEDHWDRFKHSRL